MSFSRLAQCSPFTMHALSVLYSVCFLFLLFLGTCLSFGKFAFSVSTANFCCCCHFKSLLSVLLSVSVSPLYAFFLLFFFPVGYSLGRLETICLFKA